MRLLPCGTQKAPKRGANWLQDWRPGTPRFFTLGEHYLRRFWPTPAKTRWLQPGTRATHWWRLPWISSRCRVLETGGEGMLFPLHSSWFCGKCGVLGDLYTTALVAQGADRGLTGSPTCFRWPTRNLLPLPRPLTPPSCFSLPMCSFDICRHRQHTRHPEHERERQGALCGGAGCEQTAPGRGG